MILQKTKIFIGILFMTAILASCSTLTMTTEQAISEYSKVNDSTIDTTYEKRFGAIGVLLVGERFNNGLKYIYACNASNKRCKVEINEKTTLRITKSDGRKVNLYFDTSFLKDSCLYGNKSHLADLPVGPYKITELKKIEIQTSNNMIFIG